MDVSLLYYNKITKSIIIYNRYFHKLQENYMKNQKTYLINVLTEYRIRQKSFLVVIRLEQDF